MAFVLLTAATVAAMEARADGVDGALIVREAASAVAGTGKVGSVVVLVVASVVASVIAVLLKSALTKERPEVDGIVLLEVNIFVDESLSGFSRSIATLISASSTKEK